MTQGLNGPDFKEGITKSKNSDGSHITKKITQSKDNSGNSIWTVNEESYVRNSRNKLVHNTSSTKVYDDQGNILKDIFGLDVDNDGKNDKQEIKTYEYNNEGKLIGAFVEHDYDNDGIIDDKKILNADELKIIKEGKTEAHSKEDSSKKIKSVYKETDKSEVVPDKSKDNNTVITKHGANSYKLTTRDKNGNVIKEGIYENKDKKQKHALSLIEYEYDEQGRMLNKTSYIDGKLSRKEKYLPNDNTTIKATYNDGKLKKVVVYFEGIEHDEKIYADDGYTILQHFVRDTKKCDLKQANEAPYVDQNDAEFYGEIDTKSKKSTKIKENNDNKKRTDISESKDKSGKKPEINKIKNDDKTITTIETDDFGIRTTISDEKGKTIYYKRAESNGDFDETTYDTEGREIFTKSFYRSRSEYSISTEKSEYDDGLIPKQKVRETLSYDKNTNECIYENKSKAVYRQNGNLQNYTEETYKDSYLVKKNLKYDTDGIIQEAILEVSENGVHYKYIAKYKQDMLSDNEYLLIVTDFNLIEYDEYGNEKSSLVLDFPEFTSFIHGEDRYGKNINSLDNNLRNSLVKHLVGNGYGSQAPRIYERNSEVLDI